MNLGSNFALVATFRGAAGHNTSTTPAERPHPDLPRPRGTLRGDDLPFLIMSIGTQTATMPFYQDAYSPMSASTMLSSSIYSQNGSRHQASQIAKTYRQAAQLFLTRRLPEALSTIEPVIVPQAAEQSDGEHSNEERTPRLAPIATVSKGTRVKVWSFYLTFLNSVIELGPEEGKHAFGTTKWKALAAKARDGSIWEDVVRDGYGGNEGAVDADVVINL